MNSAASPDKAVILLSIAHHRRLAGGGLLHRKKIWPYIVKRTGCEKGNLPQGQQNRQVCREFHTENEE